MKKITINAFLVAAALMSISSAFGAESPCKEVADKAIAHSKYNGSDYQNCRGNTCTYTWQEPGGGGCFFDINVPVTRSGGQCEAGKPKKDEGSANCP